MASEISEGNSRELERENILSSSNNRGDTDPDFQVDESLVYCGYKSCKPSWLQRFATVKAFAVNYFIFQFLYVAAMTYSVGVRRTLEKRFGLKAVQTGYMSSANDIATSCLAILIGYIGDRSHKPRLLSVMMSFVGISLIFCFAGTYFYLPDPTESVDSVAGDLNVTQDALCLDVASNKPCQDYVSQTEDDNNVAFYFFLIGSIIIGVATSSGVVAFPYIDQNINKADAAMYVGIISLASTIAPMIGFGLSAVTLSVPENLTESPYLKEDPRFIGAWWLGYIVFGILLCISCLPLFFFPKHLKTYYIDKFKAQQQRSKDTEKGMKARLKDFLTSTWRILSSAPLLMLIGCGVCAVYAMQFGVNLPRYLEVHFGISASTASVMMGLVGALASCVGKLIGACLMKKSWMRPQTAALFLCFGLSVNVVGFLALMLIPCQPAQLVRDGMDNRLNMEGTCNSNCSCDMKQYNPVCDESGVYYFSPCFAGCDTKFDNQSYTGCKCSSSGTVVAGTCEVSCFTSLALYGVILFLMAFCGALGEVPTIMLLLRLVGDKEKSMTFGVFSCAVFLFGLVPAPVLFGTLVDSACLVWQELCSGTGVCLHFDSDLFRLRLHGPASGFMFAALVFAGVNYFLIRRLNLEFEETDKKGTKEDENENEQNRSILNEKLGN